MDTHSHRPDDLKDLEQRLSSWQPAADGLDPDAMLFAAGRASAQPGSARLVWPALSGLLSMLCVVLGLWLTAERSERLALARQLREHRSVPVDKAPSSPAADVVPPETEEAAPDSYLASHRALEKGLDAWPVRAVVRAGSPRSPSPNPSILHAGQRDALLDP